MGWFAVIGANDAIIDWWLKWAATVAVFRSARRKVAGYLLVLACRPSSSHTDLGKFWCNQATLVVPLLEPWVRKLDLCVFRTHAGMLKLGRAQRDDDHHHHHTHTRVHTLADLASGGHGSNVTDVAQIEDLS